jgi:hypothetical protein
MRCNDIPQLGYAFLMKCGHCARWASAPASMPVALAPVKRKSDDRLLR